MSFMGVGYQEILLVFVLMLVVIGPERMPKVAYQLGKAVRTMQGYARVIRDEFQGEFDYFQEEADMIKGELEGARETMRETGESLRTEQESLNADLDKAAKSVDEGVKESSTEKPSDVTKAKQSAAKPADLSLAKPVDPSTPPHIAPSNAEPDDSAETSEVEEAKPLLF